MSVCQRADGNYFLEQMLMVEYVHQGTTITSEIIAKHQKKCIMPVIYNII
jgi:hypothetical protein